MTNLGFTSALYALTGGEKQMNRLSERALLVTLHISSWGGMMIDREVTDEVNESHKASKEAGRYNKRLIASKFFSEVSTADNHARTAHRVLTLPWEDDGTRADGFRYAEYAPEAKDRVWMSTGFALPAGLGPAADVTRSVRAVSGDSWETHAGWWQQHQARRLPPSR